MRTQFDFTPFNRVGIGFDRLFSLLSEAEDLGTHASWPSYNIARTGEESYAISIALPGFSRDDLTIEQGPNVLSVTGQSRISENTEYLHRGIEHRSFTRRFQLADYVEVAGADLVDGVLTIALKRELPEAMRPRKIQITASSRQKQIAKAA